MKAHRKVNHWTPADRARVLSRLATESRTLVAQSYGVTPDSLTTLLCRWRRQGLVPPIEVTQGSVTKGQGKHNSVPLVQKLAILRDHELGLGPSWRDNYEANLLITAYLKDPGVRIHRAFHEHMAGGEPTIIPVTILEAFNALPQEVREAPPVGCVTGRLPIVQLAWRPGRTRPYRRVTCTA